MRVVLPRTASEAEDSRNFFELSTRLGGRKEEKSVPRMELVVAIPTKERR